MEEEIKIVKAPRLCQMIREDSGYGFNLHGEKGVVGQYISAIDEDGAADRAGLCVGDRVVEVNGVNVESMSHGEVVGYIRTDPDKTILLVVDKITDDYLKRINIPVTENLASFSSVQEMFDDGENEEAMKLKELQIKNADVSDGVEDEMAVAVTGEEKHADDADVATQEASPPPSYNDAAYSPIREDSPPPVREETPPPVCEESPPPVREETPPPVRKDSPPPVRENSPPPVREKSPPPVREESPPPVREATPPTIRKETPPPVREATPPSVREATPPPAREQSPPVSESPSRGVSKKEMLRKMLGKPPKRKEVKHSHTDWKSKLDEFNNL